MLILYLNRLREWALKQKHKYMKGGLSKDQIFRLKGLGFDFVPTRDRSFERNLKKLEQYKATAGDCNVPRDYDQDPSLAVWVELQVFIAHGLHRSTSFHTCLWAHTNSSSCGQNRSVKKWLETKFPSAISIRWNPLALIGINRVRAA